MPLAESSFSKPSRSTKSRRTWSCSSVFQSIRTAPGMWPPSYAVVSSSTSANTTPGVWWFSSDQAAETSTFSRLIEVAPVIGVQCEFLLRTSESGCVPADDQVHLAPEAQAEGCVEQRRDQC